MVKRYEQRASLQGACMPFELALDGLSGPAGRLHCTQVVRTVPGKRLVCLAAWQGRTVYAKLYSGGFRAQRGWRRELAGLQALHARGIPAPAVLHAGTAGSLWVTLLAPIAPAESALNAWERAADDPARVRLLGLLVETIAGQHAAGLAQRDLHLRNFLLAEGGLYTLDGGSVEVSRYALQAGRSLDNLALLFAQFHPDYDRLSAGLLPAYCARRGWPVLTWEEAGLERRLQRHRRKRLDQYLEKAFRASSQVGCQAGWRRFLAYRRSYAGPEVEALLGDPEASLSWPGARVLKEGRTCTLWLVPVGGRRLVVKRYNIKGFVHGVRRALRRTRAAVAWENAHRLAFYGIATAPPVALIEERFGPLRRRAYLISEAVDGSHARDFFAGQPPDAEQRKAALAVVRLLRQLEAQQISHGDLKGTNIILGSAGPVLIDLDALRQHRLEGRFRRRRQRDLRRFLKNWQDNPQVLQLFQELLHDFSDG